MPDFRVLHQMFKESATIALEQQIGKPKVVLVEPDFPSSKATIIGLPNETVVIKADAFHCENVFQGSKGECKRADFIVFACAGDKKVVLFIEMKAVKGNRKEIIQQLTGAHCFFSYCQEIGKFFWGVKDFLEGFNHRFISLSHTSIPKRKTRLDRNQGCHDSPDKMMKIDCPHNLQFNMLAGG